MAFSGFHDYLDSKRQKLAVQHASNITSSLFANLRIYINGHTGSFTMVDLKKLITNKGGHIEEYLNSRVTHVLATQMTGSKMLQIRQPVIKPDWVQDCVEANHLLDWIPYRLYDLKDSKQKSLPFTVGKTQIRDICIVDDQNDENETHESVIQEKMNSTMCTAPDFIEKYFASSRLHHLSTWKSELVDFVSNEMSLAKKTQPKLSAGDSRIIMHVDMDCFFASVAMRQHPELVGKPVVIAHSLQQDSDQSMKAKQQSTSEIACANYEARAFGIKNGSYLGNARMLCPELHVLPYDFPKINECTKVIYKLLIQKADFVQAVSADEALIDVSNLFADRLCVDTIEEEWAIDYAHMIRKAIHLATDGCNASIGIASNPMMARMATKSAKPNNAFHLGENYALDYLARRSVRDLPGIGWALHCKLNEFGYDTCQSLRLDSIDELQSKFGKKTGVMLYEYCRGIDKSILENKDRQSLGAEINWGIRFSNETQLRKFAADLCSYLVTKTASANFEAKSVTVKSKKRNYEGEPDKFLGCGRCIDYSKSANLQIEKPTSTALFLVVWNIFSAFSIPVTELRGFGIHLKKSRGVADIEAGQMVLDFGIPREAPFTPSKRVINTPKSSAKKVKKDFFSPRSQKNNQARLFDEYGVSAEDLDPAVLEFLPSSLRADLKRRIQNEAAESPLSKRGKLLDFYDNPTHSQIDPEVLEDLPQSIRLELEKTLAKKSRKTDKTQKNPFIYQVENSKKGIDVVPFRAEFHGETDLATIRSWLREWTSLQNMHHAPLDVDVQSFETYLGSLLESYQMDTAVEFFKLVAHRVKSDRKGKSHENWPIVINRLHLSLAALVYDKFKSHLRLP